MVSCGALSDHSLGFLKSMTPTDSFQNLAPLLPIPQKEVLSGGQDIHSGLRKGETQPNQVYRMEGTLHSAGPTTCLSTGARASWEDSL